MFRRVELNFASKEQSTKPSAFFVRFTCTFHLFFVFFLWQPPTFCPYFRDDVPLPHSLAAVNLSTAEPRRLQDAREEEPTPQKVCITAQSVLIHPSPHRLRFDGR